MMKINFSQWVVRILNLKPRLHWDHLFRLSLEDLKKLEDVAVPASNAAVRSCRQKGQAEESCRNYIKVLLSHNERLFSCGTNAFAPECTWRDINSLVTVREKVDGMGKAPYSPHSNSTMLMTVQGDYYVASPLDFSARDYALYRIMGRERPLRTPIYDHKWLSGCVFKSGPGVQNDQGGQVILKENWTTFLKARLNCSLPGLYPFYYNEIQSVHYLEKEQLFYAAFTTGENSIYGSAICVFNMSAIKHAFEGPLKYQSTQKSAWERSTPSSQQFQCKAVEDNERVIEAQKYQLTDEAVQPASRRPLYTGELERLTHLTVDVVPTKYSFDGVHVIFAATLEGAIKKLVVIPGLLETCFVEEIQPFAPRQRHIFTMKLLKDTSSLYLGTEKEVLRIFVHRCEQYRSEESCLGSMDPYCGWNKHQLACTTAPHLNPLSLDWKQNHAGCPNSNVPVDGGWSSWSQWAECDQVGKDSPGDHCLCRSRLCNSPAPTNGGKPCEGSSLEVTNCTQHGQWTEWSGWSACSRTCGLAVKFRRRTCGNPSPKFGGRVCLGPEQEQIYCTSNPPCPAYLNIDGDWSEWGEWSQCSVPCGGGVQYRERTCDNPRPSGTGADCQGPSKEERDCNVHQCQKPEEEEWTEWSVWSLCDHNNEQHRRRTCMILDPNPTQCRGSTRESRMCIAGQETVSVLPSLEDQRDSGGSGIRTEHLVGACITCLVLGALVGALAMYRYTKRHHSRDPLAPKHLGTPLVQAEGNTYVPHSQYKNNFSTLTTSPGGKFQKEATIKRNGFRAQIHSDHNF
ncbi:hypothetical protein HPB51_021747 [Rhipicephalus microplus]|uniref:Sema domain-containing protein n=1 Tax=Rhipicephalus microplus TaxID=6941 RepID=A0A9J6DQA5_RHIMP|nr:hypothetical protein HPB51_021747 [Rhipicephalus microplus]